MSLLPIIQESLAALFAITTLMAPITMNNTTLSANSDSSTEAITAAAVTELPVIEVKHKASTKASHILVANFSGLPAPLSNVTATADYVVDDVECVPSQQDSGARLRSEHSQQLVLQRDENYRFATTFDIDGLQDEDYFGLGICHWALEWVTVRFESETTKFVGALSIDQIKTGKSVQLHYLADDFENKPESGVTVFGEETDIFRAEAGPRFTLTLTANEATK
jgi:hypothetical protein